MYIVIKQTLLVFILISVSVSLNADCDSEKFTKDDLMNMLDVERKTNNLLQKKMPQEKYTYRLKFKECNYMLFESVLTEQGKIKNGTTTVYFFNMQGKIEKVFKH